MKVKVITAFNDKENDYIKRNVGEELELEEERAKELIAKKFVEEAEVKENAPKEKEDAAMPVKEEKNPESKKIADKNVKKKKKAK